MDGQVEFEYEDDNLYSEEGDNSQLPEESENEWAQLMHPYMAEQQMMQGHGMSQQQMIHQMLPGQSMSRHHMGQQAGSQDTTSMYNTSSGNYASAAASYALQQQYMADPANYNMTTAGNYYAAESQKKLQTKSPKPSSVTTTPVSSNGIPLNKRGSNGNMSSSGQCNSRSTPNNQQRQPTQCETETSSSTQKNVVNGYSHMEETGQKSGQLHTNYPSSHNFSPSSHNKNRETPYSREHTQAMKGIKNQLENDKDSPLIEQKLTQARNELKNLRQSLRGLRSQHESDVRRLEGILNYSSPKEAAKGDSTDCSYKADPNGSTTNNVKEGQEKPPRHDPIFENWKPIGFMESAYMHKNGTPRQGCLVKESRGRIRVLDALYNNPQHSLHGLDQYSHVWIMFVFDQNSSDGKMHSKAKVAPPRLGGAKLGVFATRSPHRPNPVGLTLAKLDAVEGSTVHVSGIDILYGTPILDIKPYIPQYDAPDTSAPVTKEDIMNEVRKQNTSCNGPQTGDKTSEFEIKPDNGIDLNGSYLSMVNDKKDLPSLVNGKRTPSTGIKVTKLKCTSNFDHILAQAADIKTNGTTNNEENVAMETESPGKPTITNGQREAELNSSSQQIKDAQLLATESDNDLVRLSKLTVDAGQVRTADWLSDADKRQLKVLFNPIAERQLMKFSPSADDVAYRLQYCSSSAELRSLICGGVQSDPRSNYRRQRCPDLLHHYTADTARVSCVFLEDGSVEVLRVAPVSV